MPVLPLVDAAALLPARGALIGLDLGTKTIGVAVSDPDRRLATGVTTVARTAFSADAKKLLDLSAERRAVAFVLGLPINMDGSEGPRAQSTRAFARNPNFDPTLWTLIAANAHLGRIDDARRYLETLQETVPGITVARIRAGQPDKDPTRLASRLDGLRLAGMPEA